MTIFRGHEKLNNRYSKKPQRRRNTSCKQSLKHRQFVMNVKNTFMIPNDSDENRTRVTAVKGRCLNRLTTEP